MPGAEDRSYNKEPSIGDIQVKQEADTLARHRQHSTASEASGPDGKHYLRQHIAMLRHQADMLEALCHALPERLTPNANVGLFKLVTNQRTI